MDDRDFVGIDKGRSPQKTERRERHEVGGVPVKVALEEVGTIITRIHVCFLQLRDACSGIILLSLNDLSLIRAPAAVAA
jgi:hypothetical protein